MMVQSLVECAVQYKVVHEDVLSQIVEDSYYSLDDEVLNKVYDRWRSVLYLIRKDKGGNDLVELEQGFKEKPLFSGRNDQKQKVMREDISEMVAGIQEISL